MKLGQALLGAAIGAAIGSAAYLALEVGAGFEAPWFTIAIGAMTGLGVRMLDPSVKQVSSVARAGLAAVVALGAIVGSSLLAMDMLAAKHTKNIEELDRAISSASDPKPAAGGNPEGGDEAGDADEGAESGATVPPLIASDENTEGPADPQTAELVAASASNPQSDARDPNSLLALQFVYITVGSLVAYELSRGGAPKPTDSAASSEGPPAESNDT